LKPRLLDLFCGAGGAAMGYHRAGFDVVGVDIKPQPHYPFEFHQADALTFPLDGFDAIHASPPCQAYSTMTKRWARSDEHPDLIGPVREHLEAIEAPFVIENVVGAPLYNATMLCGSMFGLGAEGYQLRRHRLFEPHGFDIWPPAGCNHEGQALPVYGHPGGSSKRDGLKFPGTSAWKAGMGIDWMTTPELTESIPPAFTEWIGARLIANLVCHAADE